MIIDSILDRRDNQQYDNVDTYTEKEMRYMYNEAMLFEMFDLARALDGGSNEDIQRELCNYIDSNKYNPDIKVYIFSQNWVA